MAQYAETYKDDDARWWWVRCGTPRGELPEAHGPFDTEALAAKDLHFYLKTWFADMEWE
jgi:hypothetical protein